MPCLLCRSATIQGTRGTVFIQTRARILDVSAFCYTWDHPISNENGILPPLLTEEIK